MGMSKNLSQIRCFEYTGFSTYELDKNNLKNIKKTNSDRNEFTITLKGNSKKFGYSTKKDFNYVDGYEIRDKLFIGLLSGTFKNTSFFKTHSTFKTLFDFIKQDSSIDSDFKILFFNHTDIFSQGYMTGKNMHLLLLLQQPNDQTIWSKLCLMGFGKATIRTLPLIHIHFNGENQCEIISYNSRYLDIETKKLLISHFYQKIILNKSNDADNSGKDKKLSIQINRKIWLNNNPIDLKNIIKTISRINNGIFENPDNNILESKTSNSNHQKNKKIQDRLNEELKKLQENDTAFVELKLDNKEKFKENEKDIENFKNALHLDEKKSSDNPTNLLQDIHFLNEYQLSNQHWQLPKRHPIAKIVFSIMFFGISAFFIVGNASGLFDSNTGYSISSLSLFLALIFAYSAKKEYQKEKNNKNSINEAQNNITNQIKI